MTATAEGTVDIDATQLRLQGVDGLVQEDGDMTFREREHGCFLIQCAPLSLRVSVMPPGPGLPRDKATASGHGTTMSVSGVRHIR